ncbi:MAG TPA: TatD family hydrolase [Novimethylophilus sp.]|jgi:TatD DNase family protein|uniref:TatD family hydrolase n=1 Tax=Novimethylophilus sp. TaxID=2137426 RepID=UPI002F3F1927
MSDRISAFAHGLVDTHCHLDAREFDRDRDEVVRMATEAGVKTIVVPAIGRQNFALVADVCQRYPACIAAYGIHPLFVAQAVPSDLDLLREIVAGSAPLAIGEIGLDFFVQSPDIERQEYYFVEQLKIARDHDLPVILHVRRAIDAVLKHLRRITVRGGIAHAFNGSRQQAEMLIGLGFKLGFGGAMTFERALRIRELARTLPLDAVVLETDAPDIPPAWVGEGRNSPVELPHIAAVLADLRSEDVGTVAEMTTINAIRALPRLG